MTGARVRQCEGAPVLVRRATGAGARRAYSRVVRPAFLLILALLVPGQSADGQPGAVAPAESEIRRLLSAWDEAYRQRDAQRLSRILADDFTITDAAGTVLTKPAYLMSIVKTPESARAESFASHDLRIQVDGDTAIVTGRSPVKGRPRGRTQAFGGQYLFSDKWVKANGTWTAVATKATLPGAP